MTHLTEARIYEWTVEGETQGFRIQSPLLFTKNSFSQRFAGEVKYGSSQWQRNHKLLLPIALV